MACNRDNAVLREGVQIAHAIEAIIDRWRKKLQADWDKDTDQHQRIALRFVRWMNGDPERYEAVCDPLSPAGQDWVWDVARELASHGRFEAAEEIARGFAAVDDPGDCLSALAAGLVKGGALERGRRVATECVDQHGANAWPIITCGEVLEQAGDFLGAERAYRLAREVAVDDEEIRESEERRDALWQLLATKREPAIKHEGPGHEKVSAR